MKKLILIFLGLVGTGLAAQAQLENERIYLPPPGGPVIVGTTPSPYAPVVYDQPVTYFAPVQYYAPVVYNAPVVYSTVPPAPIPVVYAAPPCCDYACSSVQVIPFGGGQARQQGYQFGARR